MLGFSGPDGSSAGGQFAGCQHYAEDGSTLFVCPLAPLQWQVTSPLQWGVVHFYTYRALFTYMCLSFLLVCSGLNTHQKESCVHWLENRCPNRIGETGGMWGRVLCCTEEQPLSCSLERNCLKTSDLWICLLCETKQQGF